MMYQLLIEAAGLTQLGKIMPDWAAEFRSTIDRIAEDHRSTSQGWVQDLVVLELAERPSPHPDSIAALVVALQQHLNRSLQQLIAFSVVVDFSDISRTAEYFGGLLRFVREDNSVWFTRPVATAMRDQATTERSAPELFKLISFSSARTPGIPPYAEFVCDDNTAGEISRILAMRTRHTVIHVAGEDIPAGVATSRSGLVRLAPRAAAIPVVRPVPSPFLDLEASIAIAVLRSVPEKVSDLAGALPPRKQHVLNRYRERFASFSR